MRKKLSITVILCAAAMGVSTAQAAVVCGAVIKTPNTFLTSDLQCTQNPALTVTGPGSLDMSGHTVSCGGSRTGIKLTGSNAVLQNGTVSGCGTGVAVFGTSGNQVSNMTLQNNSGNGLLISQGSGHQVTQTVSSDNGGRGFIIQGTGNNTFSNNNATHNTNSGYEINSNNTFTGNTATNNGIMGFQVLGSGNKFNQNTVLGSGRDGYNVFGNNNILTGNICRNVLHDGINLKPGASQNTVQNNDVSGSGTNPPRVDAFDLKDENANCDSNTWTSNTGTGSQPCTGGSQAGSPGTLQFTAQTYNVGEGNGTATITVSRTGGTTGAVSVSYTTTSGGTATEGADYTFTSGVLNWAKGNASNKTFTVPIIDDTDVEGNETVNLTLSNPNGGATLGTPNTATLTITDNDQAPPASGSLQFSAANFSVNEGAGSATITATRTGGTSGQVSATYATSDGSATQPADYTAANGLLTWNDGDAANKTFTVPIIDDTTVESNETVNLSLNNPNGGATLGSPSGAVLTIADNDSVSGGASCAGQTATIVGTSGVDNLTGTSGPDVIAGLDGNDVIHAQGGVDLICGGAGNDKMFGGPGGDQLMGEDGDDALDGGDGSNDSCDGGPQVTGDTAVNCEITTNVP